MRLTIIFSLVALMLLGGCAGGAPGARRVVPLEALETRPYGSDNGAGSSFRLKQDVTINGQIVPKGKYVCGLPKVRTGTDTGDLTKVEFLIEPEFEDLVGYQKIVYGKRFGVDTWVRFDMSGPKPKEEPTPYTVVTRLAYSYVEGSGYNDNDRWVGMEPKAHRLTLFDRDGKPAITFNDVVGTDPKYAVDLLRQDGALIVHHYGYDRIYARDGTPLSPELPGFSIIYVMESQYGMAPQLTAKVFGVRTDPKRERYWLLKDDGRTMPKPDDLIGLEPLKGQYLSFDFWNGWLVWWKTPAGERCARVSVKEATSLEALMASRERAEFVEWTTSWDNQLNTFEDIVRRADKPTYEVYRYGNRMTDRTFASAKDADKWLGETRVAESEARWKAVQAADAARREELARQERARYAAEQERKRKETADAQTAFDSAMLKGNRAAAHEQILKLNNDPERWTRYVGKYGLDPAGNFGSNSVGYARASAGGTDASVLATALKNSQPPAAAVAVPVYQGPQSDWDYFWNGPRGGSAPASNYSGTVSAPDSMYRQFKQNQDATNQRNFDAWMRGAQNWGGPK